MKIKFNTNSISNPYQNEKKEAVAFVERALSNTNLDYKWISEENKIGFVDHIINYYRPEVDKDKSNYEKLIGNNWFERISQAHSEEEIRTNKAYLSKIIVNFLTKETGKFREITAKLNELETEVKKSPEVNWKRVNDLKNEITPTFSKNITDPRKLDNFYDSPIVYTYFNKTLIEEIERNRPNKNSNQQSNDKYDYQTSNRGKNLEEGDHPIIRRYQELITKIFNNYEIKEEYKRVDSELAGEIRSNNWYLNQYHQFISSWGDTPTGETEDVRNRNKKGLLLMDRLVGKMEELIAKAEAKQENNDKKRKNEENDNSSANKRPLNDSEENNFEQSVSEQFEQKNKEKGEIMVSVLTNIEAEEDPEKLTKLLEKFERENGGNDLDEKEKEKLNNAKKKILTSSQGRQKLIEGLKKYLEEKGLKKEDLDQETQKEFTDLEREKSDQEIIKKEASLTEKIGLAGAKKKLDELVSKAKGFLKINLLNKVREVKKEVIQFIADKGYNHKAYLANKLEIDQVFAQAENSKSEKSPEPLWKKAIVPVSLSVGVIAIVIIGVIVTKKRKQNKNKIKK